MKPILQTHVNSLFNSVSYCINETLIDVGDEWECFVKARNVLLTHVHFDHIYGLNKLWKINNDVKVYTNRFGYSALLDAKINLSKYHDTLFVADFPENIIIVEDGEMLDLGRGLIVKAVFTPGHNSSCITWLTDHFAFTGDSLIPGCKVVANLPYSDKGLVLASEQLIRRMLNGRAICPGHSV